MNKFKKLAIALAVAGAGICATSAQAFVFTFSQSAAITIPATGTEGVSGPYPSTLLVSGVVGTVIDVNVVFAGLTHTFPNDIDALLVGPPDASAGVTVMLMSDAGGGAPGISGVTYTFDDQAAALMTVSLNPAGSYKPTNLGDPEDPITAPEPTAPYGSLLSAYDGLDPNGTWRLYIQDDFRSDVGTLSEWRVIITTAAAVPEPASLALLGFGLAGLAFSRRKKIA